MTRLGLNSTAAFLILAVIGAPGCSEADETIGEGGTEASSTGTPATTDPAPSTGATETDTESAEESSTGADGEGGPQASGPDIAIDPAAPGPYQVGVMTVEFVDPTREEGRTLVTEIWYPATDEAIGMDTVTYGASDIFRPDAIELLGDELSSEIVTSAVRDAPMRSDAGPYPVVFFSHGSGGIRMQSTYYTVDMASHGYVVVSADHIGNTLSDIIVAGDLTTADLAESLGNRPLDLSFVREELELLEDGDPLAELMDFEHVGVTGHSFGALTSLRWMGQGADVDAVVAQAPPSMEINWLGIATPLAEFTTPLQLQVGGTDLTLPAETNADTVWEEASEPRSRMTLSNAGHFTFSDMCSLNIADIEAVADLGVSSALEDGCTKENTDPEVAGAAIRHYGIGFFNVYLRGSTPTLDLLTQEAGEAIAGDLVTWEAEL